MNLEVKVKVGDLKFLNIHFEKKSDIPEIPPSQFWNPYFCRRSQTFLRPLPGQQGWGEAAKNCGH